MSLTSIMSTATSGLLAAQTGLRTVSDNIANVNTPGYVRKVINQVSLVTLGAGSGVDVIGINRVVDKYLQSASLGAASTAGRASIMADLSDRVQSLFGDPSTSDSFFSRLDQAYSEFAALGNDPSSTLQRSETIGTLQNFFDESTRIAGSLSDLQGEADTKLRADVDRANELMSQIAKLNGDISRAKIGGADASGSENIQAQMVNELSGLMNMQVAEKPLGGVVLRTQDGMLLADEASATLTYNKSTSGAGFMSIVPAQSGGQSFDARITGGEIVGLLNMRDQEIPGALSQLTEFVSKAAAEINRVHNAHSAAPAPATLTGKNTGLLDAATAFGNFTGKTTRAFVNAAGVIQNKVDIDFTAPAPGISINCGAATAFTPANFVATLNTALTGAGIGSATFTNGALTLNAATGGVAIVDDAVNPSRKAGQGFSQFMGMNDLVSSTSLAPYDTGLTAADAHGFTAGQTLDLRVSDAAGGRIRDVQVVVPAGATMANLITALNANTTGVGPYGQFSMDANGRMTYGATGTPGSTVSVLTDATARGVGGPSISELFGIGPAERATAAGSFSVKATINQNPSLLSLSSVNLAAGTQPALSVGDGSGGAALSQAGENIAGFAAVNGFTAANMSVSRYATEFAGLLGRRSASASTQEESASAVKAEADNRRTSFEGVNMDEELVKLTTYQQAFNASARLISAANDMYDTLEAMMLR
ncbi:flagellar hook-associated protein FlgK [soil metagenome]